ncbi:MAG: hypothetical protein AAF492_12935, partial [Verrucomicrobiota bacterium]
YNLKTGLYNARYRDYHAELGRWLTRDPLFNQWGGHLYGSVSGAGGPTGTPGAGGVHQELNLYNYVLNNPINANDPDGLWVWLVIPLIPLILTGCGGPDESDDESDEEPGDCMCDTVTIMFTEQFGPLYAADGTLVVGVLVNYTIAVSGDDTSQCMCTYIDNGTVNDLDDQPRRFNNESHDIDCKDGNDLPGINYTSITQDRVNAGSDNGTYNFNVDYDLTVTAKCQGTDAANTVMASDTFDKTIRATFEITTGMVMITGMSVQ